jgi:hypothetical protein
MRSQIGQTWARYGRARCWALGALLTALGVGTLGVAYAQPAPTEDPLVMFAELMPVFTSPRCLNCHGATDPAVPVNHPGGKQDVPLERPGGDMTFETGRNEECLNCHTAAGSAFRLAPKHTSFVGLDTLPLCRHFRTDEFIPPIRFAEGRALFLDHLTNDALIGMGFEGRGGIGEDSAFFAETPAAPPPMSRQAFLAAAARWLNEGEGACSNKWNGTITETTMAEDQVTFAPAPGGRKVDTSTRLTITVVENEATAQVSWAMHDFTDVPLKECATHVYLTATADGTKLPVSLAIVIPKAPVSAPAPGPGGLPPGFALPPGIELPPGFELPSGMGLPPGVELPPGFELPPGLEMPTGQGEPFIQYASTEKSEVAGNNHLDTRSMPGCVQTITDAKQPYHFGGGQVAVKINPEEPNHLVGEKTIEDRARKTKTVIKWDLIRDQE